jgi:AraC family transcriptional regulator, regulatory protein of adaptative response / DNA-3-methyladenine glycosylase II
VSCFENGMKHRRRFLSKESEVSKGLIFGMSHGELTRVVLARDPRWDGKFWTGVSTTGIFCRPVCPAQPHPKNMIFFKSASAAMLAGFRACLRCKPERLAANPVLEGTGRTVTRALRIMDSWVQTPFSVELLAQSCGVTSRHLARLFEEHLGSSPQDVWNHIRLEMAKDLVLNSGLPLSDVAAASHFHSVRAFQSAFRKKYNMTASEKRTNLISSDVSLLPTFTIPLSLPYNWSQVSQFLKKHLIAGSETLDGNTFTRFVFNGRHKKVGKIEANFCERSGELHVRVENLPAVLLQPVRRRLQTLFDTEHNPALLPAEALKGIRVPGAFDPFEVAVTVVLGQLVSVAQSQKLIEKVVRSFGTRIEFEASSSNTVSFFPDAALLSTAPLETLGIPKNRAQAIRSLAQHTQQNPQFWNYSENVEEKLLQLRQIRGIGPWTVSLIAMRCFGLSHVWPKGDLVVKKQIELGLNVGSQWKGYEAYLAMQIWSGL